MVQRADTLGPSAGVISITTLADPRVANYQYLSSPAELRQRGLFVAEGRLVVRRLLASTRFRIRSVLVTPTAFEALGNALDPIPANTPVFVVDQGLMNEIAGFNIHRGCLALADRPPTRLLSDLAIDKMRRLVVMERVNNPDNVGGIFRSAAAFGVDAVMLGPDCGDPLYRKAVRTSMAATLQVQFADAGPWPDALVALRTAGMRVVALTPSPDARPIDEFNRDSSRIALLVGTEGEGLSADALAAADERVRIPMMEPADSLNVTVAVSIALFHFSQVSPRR